MRNDEAVLSTLLRAVACHCPFVELGNFLCECRSMGRSIIISPGAALVRPGTATTTVLLDQRNASEEEAGTAIFSIVSEQQQQ